jgi:hypothetical protein
MPRYLDTRKTQTLGPGQFVRNARRPLQKHASRIPTPIRQPFTLPANLPPGISNVLRRLNVLPK